MRYESRRYPAGRTGSQSRSQPACSGGRAGGRAAGQSVRGPRRRSRISLRRRQPSRPVGRSRSCSRSGRDSLRRGFGPSVYVLRAARPRGTEPMTADPAHPLVSAHLPAHLPGHLVTCLATCLATCESPAAKPMVTWSPAEAPEGSVCLPSPWLPESRGQDTRVEAAAAPTKHAALRLPCTVTVEHHRLPTPSSSSARSPWEVAGRPHGRSTGGTFMA
jgi:hypothetical protein